MKTEMWEQRLSDWARAKLGTPFVWGESDCAVLCSEAFDAMTGSSYADAVRGAYSTELGAARYQRRVNNLWSGLLGAGCVPIRSSLTAQAGDFIVTRGKGFWSGHVSLGATALSCERDGSICLMETVGLCLVPNARVLRIP